MNAKVDDVMSSSVIVAEPHHTIDHVRGLLDHNKIHAVPVVNTDHEPVGVVSSKDLADGDLKAGAPVSSIMTEKVLAVPRYEDVRIAARVMRNHRVSHLIHIGGIPERNRADVNQLVSFPPTPPKALWAWG